MSMGQTCWEGRTGSSQRDLAQLSVPHAMAQPAGGGGVVLVDRRQTSDAPQLDGGLGCCALLRPDLTSFQLRNLDAPGGASHPTQQAAFGRTLRNRRPSAADPSQQRPSAAGPFATAAFGHWTLRDSGLRPLTLRDSGLRHTSARRRATRVPCRYWRRCEQGRKRRRHVGVHRRV